MTLDTNLLLANPDFASIRGSLVSYLKGQARFKDYNFEGSNLSILIDLLAYNTYQNAFQSSMVASEAFLDTANLRSSIISHAKELNYTPRSARGATAIIDLLITPNDAPGVIVVPKGTAFSTSIGSRAFTFQTDRSYVIAPTNGLFTLSGISIFEGFPITEVFTVNNSVNNQRFILSNPNVDTRSLTVTIDGVEFKNASSIIELTETSQVFFLQLNRDEKYEILFGDNLIGVQPEHQSVVTVNYLVTSGDAANGASSFRNVSAISGYTDITVTTQTSAVGGSEVESTESIRKNAPRFYQTRNRAITTEDYKILLMQQFPEIQTINVYGGETIDPPQYGKVFISVDVENAEGASQTSLNTYYRYIKDKSPLTIEPILTTASFLKLKISSQVYYDYVNYNVSKTDIESAAAAAILAFNNTKLNMFNATLESSQLGTAIDSAHPAITSNDTSIVMVLDTSIAALSANIQNLQFQNALARRSMSSVTSSLFNYKNKVCWFEDDLNGNLRLVSSSNNNKIIVNSKAGTVDYNTGTVAIFKIDIDKLYTTSLEIYADAASKNVSSSQNVILAVDSEKLVIEAIPARK